jgi:hypothetical protein
MDNNGGGFPEPVPTAGVPDVPDSSSVMPFQDLHAPTPLSSSPPESARWIAFIGILVGGLLGGLIGYGVGDLLTDNGLWAAVGGLVAGVGVATGAGIVSALTLRAMNEWREVSHPEAEKKD